MDLLEGIVERITYYSDETGYTVLRIKPRRVNRSLLDKQGLATVIGMLPEIQPGESVRMSGQWASQKELNRSHRPQSKVLKAI